MRVRPFAAGLPVLTMLAVLPAAPALATVSRPSCSAGAHTLSQPGDVVYPETGNGGYTSVHTDLTVRYSAPANLFLPGTHADLTDVATQCLTSLSLDFERTSTAGTQGPDLHVSAVTVDGQPAAYDFVQPTYPGDPKGADDPDPRAHQAGQHDPVGGPDHNPLPPACSPSVSGRDADAQDGTPCPATKLVITPHHPLAAGTTFTVRVAYAGRPGIHIDGDGSTEGWFRTPGGGFVATEPIGTEDWMPLNDHPTAKPTYDITDTVDTGRTAVAGGVLTDTTHAPPTRDFPHGSTTYRWHQTAPTANYLVQNSIGRYRLTQRRSVTGTVFYEVQDTAITGDQRRRNQEIMDQQETILAFESRFTGPYPFASAGVIVGQPEVGFAEEMQTMIEFPGGQIGRSTFWHENFHQWWGDNVSEGAYADTFFKEGLATFGQDLLPARAAATKAGGLDTRAGAAAFERSLADDFTGIWNQTAAFWAQAPSAPTSATLFSGAATYDRPSAAYLALRRILGPAAFTATLARLQRSYGGSSITESQLEDAFAAQVPAGCQGRMADFFRQWFDTTSRPTISGPGLPGDDFYAGTCHR